MSEENNPDRIGRRTVLQAVGATGLVGLGMSGPGSAYDSDYFELSEEPLDEAEFTNLAEHEETGKLIQTIRDRGLDPVIENAVGVDIKASKDLPQEFEDVTPREFNAFRPRMLMVPFTNSEGEAGVFFSTTVDNHPARGHGRGRGRGNGRGQDPVENRVPATAFATVAQVDDQRIDSATSGPDDVPISIDHLAFNEENVGGDVTTQAATSNEREVETLESVEVTVDGEDFNGGGDVSTQSFHGIVSPGFCAVVVEEICRRFGDDATRRQCARVCVSRAGWNITLAAACSAFCIVGVYVINRYGCRTSGNALCNTIFQIHDRVL